MNTRYYFISVMLLCIFSAEPVHAQVELEEFATGLDRPVTITHAGDSRLFVVEQAGRILVVDTAGLVREEPFLDISSRVRSTGNEQGLLGLAFHPDYSDNGYLYVNYTNNDGNTVIARFSVSPDDPARADTASEYSLLTVDQPFTNHNGGDVKFGPDGYLYIGLGDGGSAGDPQDKAQDLGELLGKMLRIDVDGGEPYAIPGSNPYMEDTSALDEIWASGLRNPWRFSFDRESGDLWIADVGQAIMEEINFQEAGSQGGENYGWRCYEGSLVYNDEGCRPEEQFTYPVHEYSHDPGGHCSVTGGYVYRGDVYPDIVGHYFFADYCSNTLWSLHDEGSGWTFENHGVFPGNGFSTFGEDFRGGLYVAGLESGAIFRVISNPGTLAEKGFRTIRSSIWPNPAGDRLWIEPGSPERTQTLATIYDPAGKEVIKAGPFTGRFSIDLGSLPAGVYILSLEAGLYKENHRFVRK